VKVLAQGALLSTMLEAIKIASKSGSLKDSLNIALSASLKAADRSAMAPPDSRFAVMLMMVVRRRLTAGSCKPPLIMKSSVSCWKVDTLRRYVICRYQFRKRQRRLPWHWSQLRCVSAGG